MVRRRDGAIDVYTTARSFAFQSPPPLFQQVVGIILLYSIVFHRLTNYIRYKYFMYIYIYNRGFVCAWNVQGKCFQK